MSGKRRKQQARRRPQGRAESTPLTPVATPDEGLATLTPATAATPVRSPGRPAPASRYAGSVTAPRRGAIASTTAGTIDIDERVPYFAQDLRRIMVTAALMVIAIIAASLLLH